MAKKAEMCEGLSPREAAELREQAVDAAVPTSASLSRRSAAQKLWDRIAAGVVDEQTIVISANRPVTLQKGHVLIAIGALATECGSNSTTVSLLLSTWSRLGFLRFIVEPMRGRTGVAVLTRPGADAQPERLVRKARPSTEQRILSALKKLAANTATTVRDGRGVECVLMPRQAVISGTAIAQAIGTTAVTVHYWLSKMAADGRIRFVLPPRQGRPSVIEVCV